MIHISHLEHFGRMTSGNSTLWNMIDDDTPSLYNSALSDMSPSKNDDFRIDHINDISQSFSKIGHHPINSSHTDFISFSCLLEDPATIPLFHRVTMMFCHILD